MDHGDISNDVAAGVFSDWISETSSFEPLNLDDTLPDDIGCDQLLANKGGACISTNKQTDPDTCKAHGYTMIVPKSRAHWKHLWAKYGRSYFNTIPGIYKPTDGGDYTQVAMNSQAMTPGGYRAIDGGAWWLRDTLYSEPNGNYKANCWLGYRESNVDDLKFDDANCRFSTTKYICAVPRKVEANDGNAFQDSTPFSLPPTNSETPLLALERASADYSFGTCNVPVRAGVSGEEKDRCSDDNPFFLQGAHTPLFTKMKIEVSGGACGDGPKAVVFGLKVRPGADDYLPDLSHATSDMRLDQSVNIAVGALLQESSDIGCDQLLANKGGACISTNKQTDPDTCKAHGYTMIVPKSRAHWKHLWAKYGRSYFNTIPGIYKPTDGGDYTQVAMNSQAMTPGGYRAIDGGAWWLRDTLYSEPNGNYKANCWLGYRESNVDDLKFDDANCRFSTTKYICATPKPSTPTKKNKTVITTFDDLVCPQFVTAGSARFEVLVERGVAVTVTRADNSNVSWWSEDLELSCRGTVGRKTGKREMACLSTYFHQPAMMTVAGAFDILAANQRSKSDGDATGSLRGTTIAAGGDFSSERTEQRSQTHKAKCRCVTGDSTKGISICVTGCGDPVKACWMGMGCASDEKSCNGGKCTCKPSDQHENTMTFDECKRQCGRVGMSIPGDDIGVSAARGTGCGTDSEEMWIDDRMETDSVLTLNAAALALARPAQTAMSMDAATAESRRRLKGCGWLNLTHIDAFGDVLTSASGPLFMYTDSKGWVISNRVFDVALDPGPGVVFASSYRSQQLDYCDGVALRTGDLATTTVSYLVEPLEL